MDNVETMIERFVACWNEPDAAVRREVIDELWAQDGTYRNASTEFAGVRRVEEAVGQAYDAFSNGLDLVLLLSGALMLASAFAAFATRRKLSP